jgi:hypothetical protein
MELVVEPDASWSRVLSKEGFLCLLSEWDTGLGHDEVALGGLLLPVLRAGGGVDRLYEEQKLGGDEVGWL